MSGDRERRLEYESSTLSSGDFLGQANRRAEVGVLTHNSGDFIPLFVGGVHQIQGQADVNALFLAASVYAAAIDYYSATNEIPEFV